MQIYMQRLFTVGGAIQMLYISKTRNRLGYHRARLKVLLSYILQDIKQKTRLLPFIFLNVKTSFLSSAQF